MKRLLGLLFFTFIFLSVSAFATDQPRILLLMTREGSEQMDLMLTKEVAVMRQMMADAGFLVVTASLTRSPLIGNESSLIIDQKVEDIRLDDYSGVMIPCLAQPFAITDASVLSLVQEVVKRNMPVGTQRASIEVLAQAGGLKALT